MPQRAQAQANACLLHGETPRTLTDLAALGPVTHLSGGMDHVALVGTQLSETLISTNNGVALLAGMGGLAAYQDSATPFRISQNRVTLRIRADAPVHLVRSLSPDSGNAGVMVANADGEISLRLQSNGGYDGRVLKALDAGGEMPIAPAPMPVATNVISLNAVRGARQGWGQSDTGQHLNDILLDGGRCRFATLPYLGENRARSIALDVLMSFVTYLCDKRIPHARLVPGAGFIQGDLAKCSQTQLVDRILLATGARAHFALDLSLIASAWVVQIGRVAQLELYDDNRRAIAILAADPNVDRAHWNGLLAALPPATYSLP